MNEEVNYVNYKKYSQIFSIKVIYGGNTNLGQLDAKRSIIPDPNCVIFAACHDQRLPMADIQTLYRVAVERIKQDGEHVPLLRTVVLLLHREGVEEKLGRESHEQILLGTERQGFDGNNLIRTLFLYCFLQKD